MWRKIYVSNNRDRIMHIQQEQKPNKKSNNNRLVISFIRVGVVAKTDDENSLKHDKNTLLFFVCFLEGLVAENIESDLATLKIVTSMQKW